MCSICRIISLKASIFVIKQHIHIQIPQTIFLCKLTNIFIHLIDIFIIKNVIFFRLCLRHMKIRFQHDPCIRLELPDVLYQFCVSLIRHISVIAKLIDTQHQKDYLIVFFLQSLIKCMFFTIWRRQSFFRYIVDTHPCVCKYICISKLSIFRQSHCPGISDKKNTCKIIRNLWQLPLWLLRELLI